MPEEEPQHDPNAVAAEFADELGLQREDFRSDDELRLAVAVKLWQAGQIVRSFEVYTGWRVDDDKQDRKAGPVAGVLGCVYARSQDVSLEKSELSQIQYYLHQGSFPARDLRWEQLKDHLTAAGPDDLGTAVEQAIDELRLSRDGTQVVRSKYL